MFCKSIQFCIPWADIFIIHRCRFCDGIYKDKDKDKDICLLASLGLGPLRAKARAELLTVVASPALA